MDLKNKIKNYGFWVSLTSAAILVLQSLGKYFGFGVDSVAISSTVSAICGVLVVLGIISNPTKGNGYIDKDNLTKEETDNSTKDLEVITPILEELVEKESEKEKTTTENSKIE